MPIILYEMPINKRNILCIFHLILRQRQMYDLSIQAHSRIKLILIILRESPSQVILMMIGYMTITYLAAAASVTSKIQTFMLIK
jgi:hypothetical protein